MRHPLVELARKAASRAYAPYSRFCVGCAVESIDGEVAVGSNLENACYRLGVCAEVSALAAAQQAFGLARIARIAVAGGVLGEVLSGRTVVASCGACRQSILEAARVADRDIEVIFANGDGDEVTMARISELLPLPFGPDSLTRG